MTSDTLELSLCVQRIDWAHFACLVWGGSEVNCIYPPYDPHPGGVKTKLGKD